MTKSNRDLPHNDSDFLVMDESIAICLLVDVMGKMRAMSSGTGSYLAFKIHDLIEEEFKGSFASIVDGDTFAAVYKGFCFERNRCDEMDKEVLRTILNTNITEP